jgi:hypothetical protein
MRLLFGVAGICVPGTRRVKEQILGQGGVRGKEEPDECQPLRITCSPFSRSYRVFAEDSRRARAMTLLMRYAGLRISNVVTLSRDHVRGTRLEKRAIKNKAKAPVAVLVIDNVGRPSAN